MRVLPGKLVAINATYATLPGAMNTISCRRELEIMRRSGRVMDRVYEPFLGRFRPKRVRLFYSMFKIRPQTRVVDLGGSQYFWELARTEGFPLPDVTIVNIRPGPAQMLREIKWIIGDATNVPITSSSFDIVFSNSLVEHLHDWDSQVRFAKEVKRLAPAYFVQTPYRWFFVEPHFLTPFIHWLPITTRRILGPKATVWGLVSGASSQRYNLLLREIRLLGLHEMHELFPDATLVPERWMFMIKSIIAIKNEIFSAAKIRAY